MRVMYVNKKETVEDGEDRKLENKTLVSIVCLTYNHQTYIRQALDSFIMQKTSFRYEILIHDDASTDGTADIVREYDRKYPGMFHVVCQNENQYSQGVEICSEFLYPLAQGTYIALCEGDDYWTDPFKLQKQVDFLQENKDISLCAARAAVIDAADGKTAGEIRPRRNASFFLTEQVIAGGGGLFATNSMVFRKKDALGFPDFLKRAPVGDYPLAVYLSLCGRVYYMDETMSVYRKNVKGSWSERHGNAELDLPFLKAMETMFQELDQYTEYKYSPVISESMASIRFWVFSKSGCVKKMKEEPYREWYRSCRASWKARIFLCSCAPGLYRFLAEIKHFINKSVV